MKNTPAPAETTDRKDVAVRDLYYESQATISNLQTMATFLGAVARLAADVATEQTREILWEGVILLADQMKAEAVAADGHAVRLLTVLETTTKNGGPR